MQNRSSSVGVCREACITKGRRIRPNGVLSALGALRAVHLATGLAGYPLFSLAWPDPFRAGRYRLEMISARAKGSGPSSISNSFSHPEPKPGVLIDFFLTFSHIDEHVAKCFKKNFTYDDDYLLTPRAWARGERTNLIWNLDQTLLRGRLSSLIDNALHEKGLATRA